MIINQIRKWNSSYPLGHFFVIIDQRYNNLYEFQETIVRYLNDGSVVAHSSDFVLMNSSEELN